MKRVTSTPVAGSQASNLGREACRRDDPQHRAFARPVHAETVGVGMAAAHEPRALRYIEAPRLIAQAALDGRQFTVRQRTRRGAGAQQRAQLSLADRGPGRNVRH